MDSDYYTIKEKKGKKDKKKKLV